MWTTIVIVAIALLIAAAIAIAVAKAQSKHVFTCRHCGKDFQPPWTQLLFEVHAFNEHRLKCPHCAKKGFCTDKGKRR